ncbi:cobalamin biosynthesis protein CobD [Fervidobacterium sp. SC_NGM5_O18]|uniref:Cobalamin biosynthesis protein CobD n=1 Tax=Fervidobacterium pennivorans TaxID=93466 RepID=A0A172T3L7_FERPE|nr:adenosylcobinamide-phosphate synthase CbiB [Fervidobacterium pennivorans]ANE41532.1 cobalamin biosynthesis protein CobD [Fervidobacterium pennivorans]PHJ12835.1 cobalamin biosynthesis protein CobD [Fervidobacterium sp. SC_NGM5_O18]
MLDTIFLSGELFALLFAIVYDLLFGEYPSQIHPVVYMGFVGKWLDKKLNKPEKSNFLRFIFGMIAQTIEIVLFLEISLSLMVISKSDNKISRILGFLGSIYLLKSTFSIRSLYEHVARCYTDDVELLRKNVSLIVSRDVSKLDKAHLYSAAIESLAENISDSITGPLLYYSLFGLPGAVIYRVVNTYDALFGYRNEKYEWFGKFSARFDDLLNIVPSRVTAFVISLFNPISSWKYILKYGAIKINAMYPMSAFAGVLKVGIEKIGYYKLEGKIPEKEDVKKALKLYKKVTAIILLIIITLTVVVK